MVRVGQSGQERGNGLLALRLRQPAAETVVFHQGAYGGYMPEMAKYVHVSVCLVS